jgi:AmmeMemoRadiSam system protein B
MIRKPAVAGMFYPAQRNRLEDEVRTLLAISKPEQEYKNVFGLVSPHAGYIYSGRTAAYGFNLLKNSDAQTVVIISPSHREYFPGVSIFNGDGYETPLGIVEINKEMSDKLTSDSRVVFKGLEGHKEEHAVEVQIPFLQMVLGNFKIVPVVMGDQGKLYIDELYEK